MTAGEAIDDIYHRIGQVAVHTGSLPPMGASV